MALCIFDNIKFLESHVSPYDLKNLTFVGNKGCDGGEAVAVHLGNNMGGNAYAAEGMQWYTNGAYNSLPCLTYNCIQPGFTYKFKSIENKPISCATLVPTTMPTYIPSAEPSYNPSVKPTHIPTLVPTYAKPILLPTKAARPTRRPAMKPSFKPISRPSRRPIIYRLS